MSLLSTIGQQYINFVFGSIELAGLFMLLAMVLLGTRMGLSVEGYAIMLIPTLMILVSFGIFPVNIQPIILIIAGFIVGFAISRIMTRTR